MVAYEQRRLQEIQGPAPELAHEPKTAKAVPTKNAKKPISPDMVPSQPLQPDDESMVASGPSSDSKDGVPRRRELQLEEETAIKPEPMKQNLKKRKSRHLKEPCHLHFREIMISFNHQLSY